MPDQDAQPGNRPPSEPRVAGGMPPAPNVSTIATRNVDEFHSFLTARYDDHKRKVRARRKGFEYLAESGVLGNLTFANSTYNGATVELTVPPVSYVSVLHTLRGRYQAQWQGGDVQLADPHAILIPSYGYQLLLDNGRHQSITLTMDTLSRVAAEMSGPHQRDVRFTGLLPISPAAERHWLATADYIRRGIYTRSLDQPLLLAAAEHLAATIMLATFPNTTMTTEIRTPRDHATAATIRRAIAFIDEHASEPITLTDIASAAGVVPHTLQNAFRRHRDTTPLDYLRQVRLAMAHEELLAAQPEDGTTVAAVATRRGFASVNRFTTAYRQVCGQEPSQTLRT
jgi:AraC-like DNA-binding protein